MDIIQQWFLNNIDKGEVPSLPRCQMFLDERSEVVDRSRRDKVRNMIKV